jgi:hypothetical protein
VSVSPVPALAIVAPDPVRVQCDGAAVSPPAQIKKVESAIRFTFPIAVCRAEKFDLTGELAIKADVSGLVASNAIHFLQYLIKLRVQ